jgi:hypothetical protein
MNIRPASAVTALTITGALTVALLTVARMPALVALPVALVVGGLVLAALSRSSPPTLTASTAPAVITPEPPPPQYQAQSIPGIVLPSAREDYTFTFSATVHWLPTVASVADPGTIAVNDIIRRAREIAQRRDPALASLAEQEVAGLLTDARSDPTNRVQARAESVRLVLSLDDHKRLEELAGLRKQEELWDYRRRQEQSKRRYLSEDVLKDSGSAVVWWLARNDSQPEKVAETIDALTRLANAANNADANPADGPAPVDAGYPAAEPVSRPTPAEQFGTFLDSLDSLGDDARLLITKQMAGLVESHGYATVAREMTGPYDEWPAGTGPGLPGEEPESGDW